MRQTDAGVADTPFASPVWRARGVTLFLTVVSENINPHVIEESATAPTEDGERRVVHDRTRLQKLLAKQLRNFTMLFAMVLAEEAIDPVHDLRVCTRRLQQILFALVPEKNLNKARSVRRTLRRVRRALGPWRNCDVALQWVARKERRVSKSVLKSAWSLVREKHLRGARERRQTARRKLYKSGGITLNHRLQQLLASSAQRPGSSEPAAEVRQVVADAAVGVRLALERATADRSISNIHALRIQTKRLRYRVELTRDLGAHEAPALIQWFKLLQDRLGHWHDRQELNHFITRALASSDLLMDSRASRSSCSGRLRRTTKSAPARWKNCCGWQVSPRARANWKIGCSPTARQPRTTHPRPPTAPRRRRPPTR